MSEKLETPTAVSKINHDERFTVPWYRDGLHFRCTQCGKCCTGSPGFVWITEEEMAEMANFLNLTAAVFKRLYVRRMGQRHLLIEKKSQNHSCVFYQNQMCQVYAARPLQCRAYPFWRENIHSEKSWKEAGLQCEGIHPEAPFVSFETIQQFLDGQEQQNPDEHFVSGN